MDIAVPDNPLFVFFLIVVILVALQPMWFWAGEAHPKLRFAGNLGLLITVGGALIGIFTSIDFTSFSILIGVPLFAICWSVLFLHYLWLVICSCLIPMSAVTALYFSVAIGFLIFTDITFVEFINRSAPLAFICGAIGYVWTVAISGIVDRPWHFKNPSYYDPSTNNLRQEEVVYWEDRHQNNNRGSHIDEKNDLIRLEENRRI